MNLLGGSINSEAQSLCALRIFISRDCLNNILSNQAHILEREIDAKAREAWIKIQ